MHNNDDLIYLNSLPAQRNLSMLLNNQPMKYIQTLSSATCVITFFVSWTSVPVNLGEFDQNQLKDISICGSFGGYVPDPVDTSRPVAPRLYNLGTLHHTVTTSSPLAQEFFDQGLKLCYAFNHKEAHRAFMEAARLDPDCAMAYWGEAFALGSNINDPITPERELRAYTALQKALKCRDRVSVAERDYIEAMIPRYKNNSHNERQQLNDAFVVSMKRLAEKYPEDPDAQTIYADAIMNTMPWKYCDKKGDYLPSAKEAKAILENTIKKFPSHPGAHHSYIHLVEASNNPYVGLSSSDVLESLMPGAGHLIHMPAHIYIRTGNFDKAVAHNERAIKADEEYIATCQAEGLYPLKYYPHNIHFLSFSASMLGQSEKAIQAANKILTKIPPGYMQTIQSLQRLQVAQYYVYVRFGKWDEILTLPDPGDKLFHSQIVWRFARGMAFMRKGSPEKTLVEIKKLDSLSLNEEMKKQMVNQNRLFQIYLVASNTLKGEFYINTEKEKGINFLKVAKQNELDLVYAEPPAWNIPVAHFLGDALLKAGNYEEAEQVFREDQKIFPNNGWSLYGIQQSLQNQNKTREAQEVSLKFRQAWKYADITITNSVF